MSRENGVRKVEYTPGIVTNVNGVLQHIRKLGGSSEVYGEVHAIPEISVVNATSESSLRTMQKRIMIKADGTGAKHQSAELL